MKKADPDITLTKGITYLSVLAQIPIAIVFSFAMILPVDLTAFSWGTSRVVFGPWLAMFSICFTYLMAVNAINIELDKRFKWERSLIKRAGMQIIYVWILPVVVFFVLALIYLDWLIKLDVKRFDTPHVYYAIIFIPLIVNMGYLLHYKYKLAFEAESKDVAIVIEKEQPLPDEITFQQGRSQVNLNIKDIAYVRSNGNNSDIRLHEGRNVALKKTPLKLIEDKLSPLSFCRVNRSTIISRQACVKHQRKSRCLLIFLQPEAEVPVLVARAKVPTVLEFLKKRLSDDTSN